MSKVYEQIAIRHHRDPKTHRVNGYSVTWYEYDRDSGRDCGLNRESFTFRDREEAEEYAASLKN